MKNTLSIIAVVFSAVAITVSVWAVVTADARAERAMRDRELEMIERLRPVLIEMYDDLDTRLEPDEADPQTLEALFAPMFRLWRGLL